MESDDSGPLDNEYTSKPKPVVNKSSKPPDLVDVTDDDSTDSDDESNEVMVPLLLIIVISLHQ